MTTQIDISLLIRAFQLSRMLSVAATFDIADRIADQPVAADDLARGCGVNSGMLLRMLRALAAFGIFIVDDRGRESFAGFTSAAARQQSYFAPCGAILDHAQQLGGLGRAGSCDPYRRTGL